jgi:chitodextrinase
LSLLPALLLAAAAGCGEEDAGTTAIRREAVTATPAFVQINSAVPQSPQANVTVRFSAAQTSGNLIVAIVGWNDTTAAVTSVTDTSGNVYQLAVGPTKRTTVLSQSIYYAKNIAAAAAGANTVNVAFSPAAAFADVRILEYSGIDRASPLDVAGGSNGSSASSSSGAVTTTNASDLLVAGNTVLNGTLGAGTNYTSRAITDPDGDIAEDRVVTAAGSQTATAPLSSSDGWVMQIAAFKAAVLSTDTQPPTAPGALAASTVSSSQINLSWTAATDDTGVTSYLIERCQGAGCSTFTQIATGTGTTFSNTGLAASTSFSYRVRATDAAGNLGPYSNIATATTSAFVDTQPPTAPSGLTATAVSASQINLAWTAATDNVGVTSYLVERCQGAGCTGFAQIGTASGTTFNNNGLPAGTSFSYRVRATDAAGNLGPYASTATASTPIVDTTPPTAPSSLTATAVSNSQINLAWAAATDNVAVTGYLIEQCQGAGCSSFAQVGTSTTTSFSSGGLTLATTYGFRVRATDAAGNLGPYSNTASATTQSSQPATPSFVQGSYATPQTPQTSVAVAFAAGEAAGDLNVVLAGWNDATAQITSVTDSAGNSYALAIGPTVLPGALSQSIYYAKNIKAASTNTVTVSFSPAAAFPDVRILQYHNIDATNPLDVVAAGTGTSSPSTTPAVTTTNPVDMIVGGNMVLTGTGGPGASFISRMITNPDGDIGEDRAVAAVGSYSASAPLSSAGGWVMQMVAFRAAGSGGSSDTTPPTVSVTAPASGASLSGITNVTVSASDASGVASVQLLVDGAAVGAPATTTPYQFVLDTTVFASGAHTVSARASDPFGNTAVSAAVPVTFANATSDLGTWSGSFPLPIVSVNAALLPNGNVLMYDGQSFSFNAQVWNPTTNTFTSVTAPSNIFCTGIEQLADGRVMVLGGHNGAAHVGLTNINVFDPAANTWDQEPDMINPRWYPSATQLPDGHVIVMGGESTCNGCNVSVSELYDPATDLWTAVSNAPFTFPYYPHLFVLSDGRLFVPAAARAPIVSQVLDLTARKWTAVGGPAVDGGSSAMYMPDKVIKSGTSVDPDVAVVPAATTTYVIDMSQTSPTWRQVGAMNFPRTYHTLTLLPDGTVLATGGGPDTTPLANANAILPAEVWSPSTESWRTLASMHVPRLYHSLALLMPDGRVLVSGGGRLDDVTLPTDEFNAEFYSPPYLFKGARPVISSAPATLQYGQAFVVQTPDAARIAKVSLMRFGAVTHAINMGQRFVPLSFTAGTGSLTVTAPANANVATPGNYMLFILDTNGIPSIATITRL